VLLGCDLYEIRESPFDIPITCEVYGLCSQKGRQDCVSNLLDSIKSRWR